MATKSKKIAIVTGAGQGIGAATAVCLAKNGFQVVLASRNERQLRLTAKKCGKSALVCPTDVGVPAAVRRLVAFTVEKFGRVDVVVNSAGILFAGAVESVSDADAEKIIQTNLMGTILVCKYVLPLMKRQRAGHIVNVSSIAGTRARANMAVYSASKFGVVGFSDALNLEAKEYGVHVSVIRPGTVVSDLWGKDWEKTQPKSAVEGLLKPEDVARSIAFIVDQPAHAVIRDLMIHPAR